MGYHLSFMTHQQRDGGWNWILSDLQGFKGHGSLWVTFAHLFCCCFWIAEMMAPNCSNLMMVMLQFQDHVMYKIYQMVGWSATRFQMIFCAHKFHHFHVFHICFLIPHPLRWHRVPPTVPGIKFVRRFCQSGLWKMFPFLGTLADWAISAFGGWLIVGMVVTPPIYTISLHLKRDHV